MHEPHQRAAMLSNCLQKAKSHTAFGAGQQS